MLERKRFRRVGGDREITVDVRVVSATNRDLRSEVNRGSFRANLYFRLAGGRVVVPPLRERPEDVAVLVRHFALEMTGSEALPIAPDVLRCSRSSTGPATCASYGARSNASSHSAHPSSA